MAKKSGLNSQGIDPNSGYLEFGREEYSVPLDVLEIADLECSDRFDIITLFHVLEHLAHPKEVIKVIHGMLAQDGILVIEVPNLESKRSSPTNHFFKAHLNYFTSLSLANILHEYFEIELMENKDVLFAVGKKRMEEQSTDEIPFAREAVDLGTRRLKQKALPEYLLNGGLFSVFSTIARSIDEKLSTNGRRPRQILDEIHVRYGL